MLAEDSDYRTPLMVASKAGHSVIVKVLLATGADAEEPAPPHRLMHQLQNSPSA